MIYAPGTPDDYPQIEALLAQTDMPGWVSLSFQADLSAGPAHPGAMTHTVTARDDGVIVAMASNTTMPSRHGPVSWLGGLRVAPSHRGQPGLMRGGLDAIREHLLPNPPDWQMAAIVADNLPAKSLLTRGLKNFPTFTPKIEYTTFAMRAQKTRVANVRIATDSDLLEIAETLASEERPLAAHFERSEDFADWQGLGVTDFLLAETNGTVRGLVALWDQRAMRRYVVTRYRGGVRFLRPFWNAAGSITGQPSLPPKGHAINVASLSFLTAETPEIATDLIRAGLSLAADRGLGMVNLGLAHDDPLFDMVTTTFRHQPYRSTLYGVTWPGGKKLPSDWFFRNTKVELALL